MNKLLAGFARVNVTPMLGVSISGYYKERYAQGILDELEANALALRVEDATVILISLDNCSLKKHLADDLRSFVADAAKLPVDAIWLHTTHSHTAGSLDYEGDANPLVKQYYGFVRAKLADAAVMALEDLKPARMGFGISKAKNIAFIRRYRMQDGSVHTNPGVNNPQIVEPIGTVDERASILRFEQENGENIVLLNYGVHPDSVGGSKISADWPGFARRTVERALPNTHCFTINGVHGDVNHVNVHPKAGDMNDMFMDFDDVSRGYGHARHMGRVLAGAVLSAYDKVAWQDVDRLHYSKHSCMIPSSRPNAEQLAKAQRIYELHQAGCDAHLPYTGMELTVVVAEATRMLLLADGPDAFEMDLYGIALGDVALLGVPGEPFTGVGRALKQAPGWKLILPCCLTNGHQGYFPMAEAYAEGGYEARSSRFAPGVAEQIIREGTELLSTLQKA